MGMPSGMSRRSARASHKRRPCHAGKTLLQKILTRSLDIHQISPMSVIRARGRFFRQGAKRDDGVAPVVVFSCFERRLPMADDTTDKLTARLEEAAASLERSLKRSGRSFSRSAGRARDNVESEWYNLKQDLSDLLDSDSLRDRPEVRAAIDRVRDTVQNISDSAYDAAQEVQRRARDGAEAVNDYAHSSPWQTAGMAAAAGLLIGFLLSRR